MNICTHSLSKQHKNVNVEPILRENNEAELGQVLTLQLTLPGEAHSDAHLEHSLFHDFHNLCKIVHFGQ